MNGNTNYTYLLVLVPCLYDKVISSNSCALLCFEIWPSGYPFNSQEFMWYCDFLSLGILTVLKKI
jgi:hypothetical protein